MAVTRTILNDTPERTDWRDEDPTVGYVGWGTDWKTGTPEFNRLQQVTALRNALAVFEANFANWAALTNAQKDAAGRAAQRAIAHLIRQQLQDLTSPGV